MLFNADLKRQFCIFEQESIVTMNSFAILFFSISIPACGLLVLLYVRFLKWLGNKPGDWGLIKENWLIVLPLSAMLIFSIMIAVLLYVFNELNGGKMF